MHNSAAYGVLPMTYSAVRACHGRGRGFESRRPRHSFQKSCSDFTETTEDPKEHVFVPFSVSLLAALSQQGLITLRR
jgi:hypothetical protein